MINSELSMMDKNDSIFSQFLVKRKYLKIIEKLSLFYFNKQKSSFMFVIYKL